MTTWIKTTEEHYDEMLGMLPPALMTGIGFLVGEPMDHNAQGQPRYSAFAHVAVAHGAITRTEYYEAKEVLTVREFRMVRATDVVGQGA